MDRRLVGKGAAAWGRGAIHPPYTLYPTFLLVNGQDRRNATKIPRGLAPQGIQAYWENTSRLSLLPGYTPMGS